MPTCAAPAETWRNHRISRRGFFELLLTKKAFTKAKPELGRFRSFLLACLKNYLLAAHRDANALKRGGGQATIPLEWDEAEGRYQLEPAHDDSPEKLFDRNWARTLMTRAARKLQKECEAAGLIERFNALGSAIEDPHSVPIAEIAHQLGISEGGAKTAVRRFRLRFRELFEESVAELLDDPRDFDREVACLLEALR